LRVAVVYTVSFPSFFSLFSPLSFPLGIRPTRPYIANKTYPKSAKC
jgi:hypothetical protein